MPSIFPTLNLVAHDYLPETNGAPAIATFARASAASRVDGAGVLGSAGNDVLRQDYHPITGEHLGWPIEAARTNILLHSEGFDDADWEKIATSITADAIAAPDDSPTADKLVEDSSSGAHSVRRLNALTGGVTYTGSVFAKAAERTTLQMVLGFGSVFGTTQAISVDLAAGTAILSSGSPTFGIEPYQDGWYHCWLSQVATATGSTNLTLAINNNAGYAGDGSSGLYLWGAQFEVGGHASSYLATTGSAVTREADTLTIPLTAFPYNTREGTLFAEVSLDALPPSSAADDRQHVAHLYGLDNESRWFFREDGLVFLGRRDGGAFSSHDNRLIIPGFAPGTVYRCAVAFKRDDFVVVVDGQLSALFAHTLGIAAATELRIGRDGTSRFLDGHLRHLAYFPRRLEDDALRRITV